MLTIRLARTGKKKHAYFRLIVSEKTKDTHGDYLELLGHVNPHKNPWEVVLKADRVKHWLDHGAQTSASVHNLLVDQKLIKAEKLRVWKAKKKDATEAPAAAPATKKEEAPAKASAESSDQAPAA